MTFGKGVLCAAQRLAKEHLLLRSAYKTGGPLWGTAGTSNARPLIDYDETPTPSWKSKVRSAVIEQAIDTAALMLGSDKSRGHCLEMICADCLAGAHLEGGSPKILLLSMIRLFPVAAGNAEIGISPAG